MNITEQLDESEIKERLRAFVRLTMAAAQEQPDSQLIREQNLLVAISKITDDETANNAKDLCDHKKHGYNFDTYLYWLSELYNLLWRGVPSDTTLSIINDCIVSNITAIIYEKMGVIGSITHSL